MMTRDCNMCGGSGGEYDCNDEWVECDLCGGQPSAHGHAHRCPLCSESKMCHRDGCNRLPGEPLTCEACSGALDKLDDTPAPKRPELGIATLVRIVARGTRAALAMRATDPECCPAVLEQHIAGMLPVDPTRTDADTWARLGAVQGARDAWAGAQFIRPPDCPPGEVGASYAAAWMVAANVVMIVRMEVYRV